MRELETVGNRAERLVASVARRYGLSHAALIALAVVEGAGGPLPAGEIGARMHLTTGSTTSLLDTLERNGHVQRLPDAADRRRVLIEITPAAHDVLDHVLVDVQHLVAATLAPVDDVALEALLDTLAKVNAALVAAPDVESLPPPQPRRTPSHLRRN
jgi:DNA-binding MarR family transcriptional regulator